MTNTTIAINPTNVRLADQLRASERATLQIKRVLQHIVDQYEVVYRKSPKKACYTVYIADTEKPLHRGKSLFELWNTRQGLHLCTREKHENSTYHADWNFKYDSFPASYEEAETAILQYMKSIAE